MWRTGLLLTALLLGGCGITDRKGAAEQDNGTALADKGVDRFQQACASEATYDRLKELAFDEAARIRGGDSGALDQAAEAAVVRMENPTVAERDEEMDVTVCSGRFVLELPPGTENAFDGQRRITADIQYAAQNATDGSGLVYQMEGAEPIIYRLATVGGLRPGQAARVQAQARAEPVAVPQPSGPPGSPRQIVAPPPARPVAQQAPRTAPRAEPRPEAQPRRVQRAEAAPAPRTPAPRAEPAARPRPAAASASVRPSFNCRYARTRTERMVCSNGGLAAQDRRMASAYYARLANADATTRQRLRATRDRFLARRERCRDEACVSAAYEQREAEIRAIRSGE